MTLLGALGDEGQILTFEDTLVASAEQKAGEANDRAAANEKEAALLRKLAQGRRLTELQIDQIATSLKPFAGRRLLMGSYPGDAEAARLGLQISTALRRAGIDVLINQLGKGPMNLTGTINFGVHVAGPEKDKGFLRAIANSLHLHGKLEATTDLIVPSVVTMGTAVEILVGLQRLPGTE